MNVAGTGEVVTDSPRAQSMDGSGQCFLPEKRPWAGRWFLLALIFAFFFSMGHLAGAFQKEQEVLRAKAISAETFEIRGEDKKLRASLFTAPGGAALLSFFDGSGRSRLTLGIGPGGAPIISMFNDKGSLGLSLGLDADDGAPLIALFDGAVAPAMSLGIAKGFGPHLTIGRKGQGQIAMSVANGRSSSIQISDSKNIPRISLSVSGDEPAIRLLGDNNTVRTSWLVHSDGTVSFSLYDVQARRRLVIMTDKDGRPSIKFLDPDTKEAKAL